MFYSVICLFLSISFLSTCVLFYQVLRIKKHTKLLQKKLFETNRKTRWLLQADVGLGNRLSEVQKQCETIEDRQEDIVMESNRHDNKHYQQAVKMVEMGMDIQTVIGMSGLSRAEVETIYHLKKVCKRNVA